MLPAAALPPTTPPSAGQLVQREHDHGQRRSEAECVARVLPAPRYHTCGRPACALYRPICCPSVKAGVLYHNLSLTPLVCLRCVLVCALFYPLRDTWGFLFAAAAFNGTNLSACRCLAAQCRAHSRAHVRPCCRVPSVLCHGLP